MEHEPKRYFMYLCIIEIYPCSLNVLYSTFHQFLELYIISLRRFGEDVSMDGLELRWGTSTCWRSNGDVWIYRCHHVEDGEEPTESRKETKSRNMCWGGWFVLKVGFWDFFLGGILLCELRAWDCFFWAKFVKGEDFFGIDTNWVPVMKNKI